MSIDTFFEVCALYSIVHKNVELIGQRQFVEFTRNAAALPIVDFSLERQIDIGMRRRVSQRARTENLYLPDFAMTAKYFQQQRQFGIMQTKFHHSIPDFWKVE